MPANEKADLSAGPSAAVNQSSIPPFFAIERGERFIDLGALQKAANRAARNDPLAALYGALSKLAWLAARYAPDMTADLDPAERRRIDSDLEDYTVLLRKVQAQIEAVAP